MGKFTEPPLFTRTYDLILWINRETTLFPKSQRFTLAQRIQNESLDLLKCFISARRGQCRMLRELQTCSWLESQPKITDPGGIW